ncbi:MAG: hypothetical protein IKP19_08375 [Oscillospiraceae bacterium]|nr:hypothetical protein [Oscillospiraceae bacterium]
MKYLIRLLGLIGLCLLLVCFAAAAEVPEETEIPEAAEEAVLPAPEAEEAPAFRRKVSESVYLYVDSSYYIYTDNLMYTYEEILRDTRPQLNYVVADPVHCNGSIKVRDGLLPVIVADYGNAGSTYFAIRREQQGLYRIEVVHSNHLDSSLSYSIERAKPVVTDQSIVFTSIDNKEGVRISWSLSEESEHLKKELTRVLAFLEEAEAQPAPTPGQTQQEEPTPGAPRKDPEASQTDRNSAPEAPEKAVVEPVTNEVSVCYRSEDGTPLWTLTVRGSFRAENDGFVCTDAAGELAIFDDSWSKASLEFYPDGSVAVGNLKMQRSALGIVVGTKELRFVVGANSD